MVQVRLIFRLQRATTEPPADDATARSAITFVPLRVRLVEVLDEAAERVVRDELLALELDARLGRGVVVLEPLLDGAALVGEAVGLKCDIGSGDARVGQATGCGHNERGRRAYLRQ